MNWNVTRMGWWKSAKRRVAITQTPGLRSAGGNQRRAEQLGVWGVGCLLVCAAWNSCQAGTVTLGLKTPDPIPGQMTQYVAPDLPAGFFGQIGGVDSDPILSGAIPFTSGPDLIYMPVQKVIGFVLTGPGAHLGTTVGHMHTYLQPVWGTVLDPFDTMVRYDFNRSGFIVTGAEVTHLSLQSYNPLPVTYGPETASFRAYIDLDLTKHSTGTVEMDYGDPETTRGGTAIINFTIHALIRFQQIGGTTATDGPWKTPIPFTIVDFKTPVPENFVFATIEYNGPGSTAKYEIIPEPGTGVILALGVCGMLLNRRRVQSLVPGSWRRNG